MPEEDLIKRRDFTNSLYGFFSTYISFGPNSNEPDSVAVRCCMPAKYSLIDEMSKILDEVSLGMSQTESDSKMVLLAQKTIELLKLEYPTKPATKSIQS